MKKDESDAYSYMLKSITIYLQNIFPTGKNPRNTPPFFQLGTSWIFQFPIIQLIFSKDYTYPVSATKMPEQTDPSDPPFSHLSPESLHNVPGTELEFKSTHYTAATTSPVHTDGSINQIGCPVQESGPSNWTKKKKKQTKKKKKKKQEQP